MKLEDRKELLLKVRRIDKTFYQKLKEIGFLATMLNFPNQFQEILEMLETEDMRNLVYLVTEEVSEGGDNE